jgi:hypothetical protein
MGLLSAPTHGLAPVMAIFRKRDEISGLMRFWGQRKREFLGHERPQAPSAGALSALVALSESSPPLVSPCPSSRKTREPREGCSQGSALTVRLRGFVAIEEAPLVGLEPKTGRLTTFAAHNWAKRRAASGYSIIAAQLPQTACIAVTAAHLMERRIHLPTCCEDK